MIKKPSPLLIKRVLHAVAALGGRACCEQIADETLQAPSMIYPVLSLLKAKRIIVIAETHEKPKGMRGRKRFLYVLDQWPDWAGSRPAARAIDDRDKPKRRRCLTCSNHFDSDWAGNRICGRCTRAVNEAQAGYGHATSGEAGAL